MSVTPDFVGQIYKDTNTGNLWRANSLTPGDWTLELQNMQVKWLPHTLKMGENFGLTYRSGIVAPTEFVFEQASIVEPFIVNVSSVTAVRLPNLVSVDPDFWWGTDLDFSSCQNLVTFEAPLLQNMGSGSILLSGCSALTSLSLPSLATVAENIVCNTSGLVTVSFPNYLPTNGKTLDFLQCALSAASVNHILARCVANAGYVSGAVTLGGGTSAAPTGQGIADKATLLGRGVTLNTN